METIRSKRTSASRSRSPSLKKIDTGACPLPTKAELDYAKEIFQSLPKEAKTIITKMSSSPKYDSKGKKLMIGGAHWIHILLASIFIFAVAGVGVGTVLYFFGDAITVALKAIEPCEGKKDQVVGWLFSWVDDSLSCAAKQARFDRILRYVQGSVGGGVLLTYTKILTWVEANVPIPTSCRRDSVEHTVRSDEEHGDGGAHGGRRKRSSENRYIKRRSSKGRSRYSQYRN